MICVSIGSRELLSLQNGVELVELRADLCGLNLEELPEVLGRLPRVIFTCKITEKGELCSSEIMQCAINEGVEYIDLEYDAPIEYLETLMRQAARCGVKVILSYHNFEGTDSLETLEALYNELIDRGADIVKIVTTALTFEEATRTMQLYEGKKQGTLLAFSMGKIGRFTRQLSLSLGAPFSYVALSEEQRTAEGQYLLAEMYEIVAKDNYPYIFGGYNEIRPPLSLKVPASKSVAQRAIIAACLAKGVSRFSNFSPSDDIMAAINVASSLGAGVEIVGDELVVDGGIGEVKVESICVGESGLLTRLMLPMALYLGDSIEVNGCGTLPFRSLRESVEALERAGAVVHCKDWRLPIIVSGTISRKEITFSGAESSQIVSGFLMTLPLMPHSTVLRIENPTSLPYIFLTLKVLQKFGVVINIVENSSSLLQFEIAGSQRYTPANLSLDGDWSSAAPFAVAGVLHNSKVELRGMNMDSSQADKVLLDVLKDAGCSVEVCDDGALQNVVIKRNDMLKAFSFDATNSPDLFPILAVLATQCSGESAIVGLSRLYQKESNRAVSVYSELTKLGAKMRVDGDTLYIRGGQLYGAVVSSHCDHRMAMALIVASLFTQGAVALDNINALDKSFPKFLTFFER